MLGASRSRNSRGPIHTRWDGSCAALGDAPNRPDEHVDLVEGVAGAVGRDDRFDLGVVPMSKAFANSCNTTFAELASRMPPRALNQTAAIFGIGRDYVVDGLPTVSGQVPPTVDLAELTEDGFVPLPEDASMRPNSPAERR